MHEQPDISVIVPAKNEETNLPTLIAGIQSASAPFTW